LFLKDDADPLALRLARIFQSHLLPFQADAAVIRFVDACEQLHEGRFAGTIFAHHSVDLATANRKTNVVERGHSAEALGNALEFDERFFVSHLAHVSWRYMASERPDLDSTQFLGFGNGFARAFKSEKFLAT
jgi:hypothetical protein